MGLMAMAEAPPVSTESSSPAGIPSPVVPAPTTRSRTRSSRHSAALYPLPAFLLYALFVLWPVIRVGWIALHNTRGFVSGRFVGLLNFRSLWSDSTFHTSLWHSALWELGATVAPALLGLSIALLALHCRFSSGFLSVLFMPALLPATVVAGIWIGVYSPSTGLIHTFMNLVAQGGSEPDWLGDPHLALGSLFAAWVWSSAGIAAVIFLAALRGIPREYREVALIEGAGPLWRFRNVTLPAVRRVGAVVLIIEAALGAQIFDLVFVTTGGGPGYATMVLPLEVYGRTFGGQMGPGAAAACVQVVLVLLLLSLTVPLMRSSGHRDDPGDRTNVRTIWPATAVLGGVLGVWILPLLWLLAAAFTSGRSLALRGAAALAPGRLTWSNMSAVWSMGLPDALWHSFWLAGTVVLTTLLLALPAAFALTFRYTGRVVRAAALTVLLFGVLQPSSVTIVPLFVLLNDLSLLNSAWGIVLPEIARALPFAVLILWGFMTGLPRHLTEAAAVDGATPRQQLLRVVLPLTRPAVFAAAIWSFAGSWNEYLLPTIVSQDGTYQTLPTLLGSFIGKFDTQYGLLAATLLLSMLAPVLILTLLGGPAARALRSLERGIR